MKDVLTASQNPTANSICKLMHQFVGNILHTMVDGDPPENVTKANELIDEVSSISQHAMRTSVHTSLVSSPGTLVLSCDVFLNVPLLVDWHVITQKREHIVNYRLMWKKTQCQTYDHTINQKVLEKVHDSTKLAFEQMAHIKSNRYT